jgi:hypothetical protein
MKGFNLVGVVRICPLFGSQANSSTRHPPLITNPAVAAAARIW